MRNKIKFALLAFFLAVVLVGPAGAATIVDDTAHTSYVTRYIAYEMYNSTLGINADNVPVYILTNAAVVSSESKNLVVQNGEVNLSGQNVFLLADGTNLTFAAGACGTAPSAGTEYIIGESSTGAVPSASISINIYDGLTFCTRNDLGAGTATSTTTVTVAPSYIAAGLGNVDAATGIATRILNDALNFHVVSGLAPSCSVYPTVQLAYIASNETASYTTILTIRPQFAAGAISSNSLSAELNTDTDFTTFIYPYAPNANVLSTTNIQGTAYRIVDNMVGNESLWKAYVPTTATATVSVSLNSVNEELGLTVSQADTFGTTSACSTTTNTAWTCGLTDQVGRFAGVAGNNLLYFNIVKNTAYESNPTAWTISNATLTLTGGSQTTACFAPAGQVGVWFGGLEAWVPFVKSDASAGYETYIKLFNRYDNDAKIYIKTFKGDSNATIIATAQLASPQDVIAADDMITITGSDLAALFPTVDFTKGIPVKFLIRVPGQLGTITYNGTEVEGVNTGTVTPTNAFDPYVDGIVVSTFASGQRTVPLKFKSFKNGEYNE